MRPADGSAPGARVAAAMLRRPPFSGPPLPLGLVAYTSPAGGRGGAPGAGVVNRSACHRHNARRAPRALTLALSRERERGQWGVSRYGCDAAPSGNANATM
jgi:hypothetical protein